MLLSQAVTGRDMSDLIYDVPEYNATYDAERLVNWSPPATAPPPPASVPAGLAPAPTRLPSRRRLPPGPVAAAAGGAAREPTGG